MFGCCVVGRGKSFQDEDLGYLIIRQSNPAPLFLEKKGTFWNAASIKDEQLPERSN